MCLVSLNQEFETFPNDSKLSPLISKSSHPVHRIKSELNSELGLGWTSSPDAFMHSSLRLGKGPGEDIPLCF